MSVPMVRLTNFVSMKQIENINPVHRIYFPNSDKFRITMTIITEGYVVRNVL
jgi:hypothetical protein